jgi:hypothetical protein
VIEENERADPLPPAVRQLTANHEVAEVARPRTEDQFDGVGRLVHRGALVGYRAAGFTNLRV